MSQITKEELLHTFTALTDALQKSHPDTPLVHYLVEIESELKKSEGVGFTGTWQQFLNKGKLVKSESDITFTEKEQKIWQTLYSYQELGNNIWGAGVQW
ncbi:MAG: hypothetical protein Q4A67_03865 [Aerococcus sp.]|nr:hypothetical protein [Aerococcus sp.]